jgi:hypothetical protein
MRNRHSTFVHDGLAHLQEHGAIVSPGSKADSYARPRIVLPPHSAVVDFTAPIEVKLAAR